MRLTIGVMSLQGAVEPHIKALTDCGARAERIRAPEETERLDGLILPGGESTTIGLLMDRFGLMEAVQQRAAEGMPVYGACAGMILMAKQIADSEQPRLGLMDIRVRRNAYGRQVDSFESPIEMPILGGGAVPRRLYPRARNRIDGAACAPSGGAGRQSRSCPGGKSACQLLPSRIELRQAHSPVFSSNVKQRKRSMNCLWD